MLVLDDDAAVDVPIQWARDAAVDSIIGPICNRLLIKGVRVRSDHTKGIVNHAYPANQQCARTPEMLTQGNVAQPRR